MSEARLQGRICLITGASRGIGAAVAKAFAAEGAQTILVARTQGGLEAVAKEIIAAGGASPALFPLDLTDDKGIAQLADAINRQFGRLDVLVANAGMLGVLGPLAQSDEKKFSQTINLNLVANYNLIRALDPLLRQSASAAAIFVSAGVARTVTPYWGAYAISKVALEHMAQLYAAETGKTSVKVHIIDPGAARTKLRAEAFPGEPPESQPAPEAITNTFVEMAMADNLLPSGGRVRALAAS